MSITEVGSNNDDDDAVSRRDVLRSGMAAALTGVTALAAEDAVAQATKAPAVLTGTMSGRRYRAFVRHGAFGSVEELRMLSLNEDRVVVRTEASQCTYTECQAVLGNEPEQPASIRGFGGVGIVEAVGSRVRRVQVGDRVFVADAPYCGQCYACLHGRADRCLQSGGGGVVPDPVARLSDGTPVVGAINCGGFAELIIVPEWFCVPLFDIPASSVELALLHETNCVGLGCVFEAAPVQPGSDVVVFGCGPVGLGAIQGARIKGASQIIAVEPIPERRAIALKVGATLALDPNDYVSKSNPGYDFRSGVEHDNLVLKLRELCKGPTERRLAGGRPNNPNLNHVGPDYVIEAVGGDLYPAKVAGPDPTGILPLYQAWAACNSAGHVTTVSWGHDKDFVLRGNQWSNGSKNHHPGTHNGETSLRDLPLYAKLIRTGQLFNATAQGIATYPLDRIKEAYRHVADRTVVAAVITF